MNFQATRQNSMTAIGNQVVNRADIAAAWAVAALTILLLAALA